MTATVSNALLVGLAALTGARAARAAEPPALALGADLGYALPGGSLERGSALSDVTWGAVRVDVDGAYRLHPLFSVGAAVHYGVVVPRLCETGGDCTSSLGSDLALALLGRWHVGTWRGFEPAVDLELGYEWFSANHSDRGVVSTRGFRGLYVGARGDGQFRLSRLFSLGPFGELSGGTFNAATLEAPGVRRSRDVAQTAAHVWFAFGVRSVVTW